jgi:hypothetical protein
MERGEKCIASEFTASALANTAIQLRTSTFNQNKYYDFFWGCSQLQQFLFPYSPFYITACFGLYRPSSGEIYTVVFRSYYAYNRSVFRLVSYYIM